MEENMNNDDGSLAFLNIPRDEKSRSFNCEQKLIRKSTKKNLCRMVSRLNKRSLSAREYKQRISPWLGWAKHSNSKHLLQTIIPKSYASIL